MTPPPGGEWMRLNPRKLLLDPVKTLGQLFVPAVIAIFGISQSGSGMWLVFAPLGALAIAAAAMLPWFFTHYRMTDTRFEMRRGILNKSSSTAPLDRIRSVDLEATIVHRILGLQRVQIGTGVDDERIELDALAKADAAALRETLLRASGSSYVPPSAAGTADPDGETATDLDPEAGAVTSEDDGSVAAYVAPPPPEPLANIDWSWLRFAPFSFTKLVVVAGVLGVLSQFADELPIWDAEHAKSAWEWLIQWSLLVVIPTLFVGSLVAWLIISIGGYIVQWWDFALTRDRGNLHMTSGLLTTKSTTVEEARVRGVELTEPLLMRMVGGAELSTLSTGLESGVTQVVPTCPRDVATRVGADVLEDDQPLQVPLIPHGPRARRRLWTAAMLASLIPPALVAIALVIWEMFPWSWWAGILVVFIIGGMIEAELTYRNLGHRLTDKHLVAGSGALKRTRTVLEVDGIIGWTIDQSLFQRRLGLATLTATTAAGSEHVIVSEIDLAQAVALAHAATPGMLAPYVEVAG